jgi:hypothetical protein
MKTKTKLELEYRNEFKKAVDNFGNDNFTVMTTPPIDEDYWVFRIKIYKDQSIVAFPKFGTIGIGFAKEEDWNTNLPYQCTSDEIYNHIKHNKLYKEITAKICKEAIMILQNACKYYKENEMSKDVQKGDEIAFGLYIEKLKTFVNSNTKTFK